jgi:hypothetical protein
MTTKAEPIDMSPRAIERRLDDVRALYRLTRSLGSARVLGPIEPARASEQRRRDPR